MCSVFTFLAALLTLRQQFQLIRSFPTPFQSDHHPKTMPPRRPLLDLCLTTLFKMMPPNEQMVASKMSPRYAVLVRAANRTVKSLVITDQNVEIPSDLKNLKNRIHCFSLASNPAMQPVMDIPGEPSFPDYPVAVSARLSKWHCLVVDPNVQIDTATTEQIVSIFSAVTDLKYIAPLGENFRRLIALLQHPQWQCQLTHFMAHTTKWLDGQQSHELITAINDLTALQYLALDWCSHPYIPGLTILAQLKVVALNVCYLQNFLRSLERYATDNADLQVHLLNRDTKVLLSLSQPLHSRIVRYGWSHLDYSGDQVPLLCSQFRSLTSLYIKKIKLTDFASLFTALSQLPQLVHLWLWADLKNGEKLPPPARPLAQLNTLRALELSLTISSHSEVQWLNLPVTMPNLYTIYIEEFYCRGCDVQIGHCTKENSSLLPSSEALNCFQSSLFTLHSDVPMNRLILDAKGGRISAEELLLQSASEPGTEQC